MNKELFSREQAVGALFDEEDRVSYDGKDASRLQDIAEQYTNQTVKLIHALGGYKAEIERPVDEDSTSRMGYARRELIEAWAMAQAALSKISWVIRFEGEEAYFRTIVAMLKDNAIDMRGL